MPQLQKAACSCLGFCSRRLQNSSQLDSGYSGCGNKGGLRPEPQLVMGYQIKEIWRFKTKHLMLLLSGPKVICAIVHQNNAGGIKGIIRKVVVSFFLYG